MNFPKFWVKGEAQGASAWGWSNEGVAQAKALATEIAQRVAARLARGERDRLRRYEYGERPLREEVLREFRDGAATARAVITRNSYGSLILNTAGLLFVDVDLGEPPRRGGVLSRLLGSEKDVAAHEAARKAALERAEDWVQRNPGWGWRIYETRAGLRLAATHRAFLPEESACRDVFEALQADPLYRRLCAQQKCFRARLTPKPWRCDVRTLPARWPFTSERQSKVFQKWEERYLAAASRFATCRLITEMGSRAMAAELSDLIGVHDEATRCGSELPLA
jgi:hypothetical protein